MPSKLQNSLNSLDLYVREVGKLSRLSYEEEIELAEQVRSASFLQCKKEALTVELQRQPTLDEWASSVNLSAAALEVKLQQGNLAKQKMVESSLRLVMIIAKNYIGRGVEFLDLIQEGNLKLLRAAEKFDPAKGCRFSTYAVWWIRQAMLTAITKQSRTIRLPAHIRQKVNQYEKVKLELSQHLGRNPTLREIAVQLDTRVEVLLNLLRAVRQPISLNSQIGKKSNAELLTIIEDSTEVGALSLETITKSEELEQMLSILSELERLIVSLQFGLINGKELSLRQIARSLNLSSTKTQYLAKKAMNKMRSKIEMQKKIEFEGVRASCLYYDFCKTNDYQYCCILKCKVTNIVFPVINF
jgi:RNA polymerase nonessential primary-like sigma factor